jgi:hypothetical protein
LSRSAQSATAGILPVSKIARLFASVEVICGVMLLLFGVSELLECTMAAPSAPNWHEEGPAAVGKAGKAGAHLGSHLSGNLLR